MANRDDLSLKIPAYLRGELSSADAKLISSMANKDADFAADIEFQKTIRSGLKQNADTQMGLEFGWARLSKAIDEDSTEAKTTDQTPVKHMADLHSPGKAPSRVWQYAAALLACIVIAQTAFMSLDRDSDTSEKYIMVGSAQSGYHLTVKLKEAAPAKDVIASLKQHDAVVISGEALDGEYKIAFSDIESCQNFLTHMDNDNDLFETYTACQYR